MRLSSIKLSGFKSFVDPTNFQVPGQLVGVVGRVLTEALQDAANDPPRDPGALHAAG